MRSHVRLHLRGYSRAAQVRRRGGIETIAIDVDGCLTDGRMVIDGNGEKAWKAFGPDDHTMIQLAQRRGLGVVLITADRQAEKIVLARASHMRVAIIFESDWRVNDLALAGCNMRRTAYIGDGCLDARVFPHVGFGFAPSDAWPATRAAADAVTSCPGGRRAVAQAIDYTLRRLTA